jgi:multisubunit Na+/H+ antiporter MnhG subunit
MNNNLLFLLGVLWLILAEITYILFCKFGFKAKEEYNREWAETKFMSYMISIGLMGVIYCFYLYWRLMFLSLLIIGIIILIFYFNYKLGLWITNKK